ncbi:hypothetical protein QN239_10165 [Mycolicibacterium sp. Y3]
MNSTTPRKIQMFAAAVGAGALVAIGVLGALFAHSSAPMASNTMQIGVTTTLEPTPPSTPEVARAVPAIKGPAK